MPPYLKNGLIDPDEDNDLLSSRYQKHVIGSLKKSSDNLLFQKIQFFVPCLNVPSDKKQSKFYMNDNRNIFIENYVLCAVSFLFGQGIKLIKVENTNSVDVPSVFVVF